MTTLIYKLYETCISKYVIVRRRAYRVSLGKTAEILILSNFGALLFSLFNSGEKLLEAGSATGWEGGL